MERYSFWRTELCLRELKIASSLIIGLVHKSLKGNWFNWKPFSQDTNYRSIISNGDIEGTNEVQNGYFDGYL